MEPSQEKATRDFIRYLEENVPNYKSILDGMSEGFGEDVQKESLDDDLMEWIMYGPCSCISNLGISGSLCHIVRAICDNFE